MENTLYCPSCHSDNVATSSVQRFHANRDVYLYEAVKPHHSYSEAVCLSCNWVGVRSELLFKEGLKDCTNH